MRTFLRPCRALPVLFALATLLVLPACRSAAQAVSGGGVPEVDPVSSQDWAADLARFAAEDASTPPPPHPVVFTGSSSVRLWTTLADDFPGVALLNRGFGGSQVRDAVWHADALVLRYRPRQVVIYAGDNDIDAGRSPAQVLHDVQAFVARVRAGQPGTRVSWISIKPSPLREAQLPRQREANALVAAWAATQRGVDVIDVSTPMLDAHGRPDARWFVEDRLHLNPQGYALWRRLVSPYIDTAR